MTIRIPASLAVLLVAAAALAAGFTAGRAHAAAPAGAELRLIASASGTDVFAIQYEGHACLLASTKGGAGVSLQCPR